MRSTIAILATATVAALACGPAAAQTLYKLIDKNGKVTYSESPPKNFDGKVIRMDIDPKANTATLQRGSSSIPSVDDRRASDERLQSARAHLEATQKALAEAKQNPEEGEVERIGKKGGGARAIPSDEYQRKLERLEREVKDAEEELKKVQRER